MSVDQTFIINWQSNLLNHNLPPTFDKEPLNPNLPKILQKKNPPKSDGFRYVGISLSFRAVTSQVFSAPLSLTSVFGMGTGGPSASSTPTILLYLFFPYLRSIYHLHGDSCGNRTRVAGVRGRSLNRLTNEPSVCNKG